MTPANPRATIELDGQRWDSSEDARLFKGVTVNLVTNEASEATWTVFDPHFRMIDKYTRADGVPLLTVRVWLGFGDELGQPVFKGLLARVERGSNETTFRFYDMGFKMRLEKRTGYHNKKDDVAIIRKLAQRNGLKFIGPEKPLNLGPHEAMAQDEKTDWEHAMERAEDSGLVLYVREDTLFAKQPAKVGNPKFALSYKKDFVLLHDYDLSFKVPENQEGRPRRVEVRGRRRGGKRLSGYSDTSQRGTSPVSIKRDLPEHSKRAATRRAQAQKELQREHAFQCNVRHIRTLSGVRADVRDTIRLENVGKLFSGLYLCNSVSYGFSPGSFNTSLELYRDVANG